MDTYEKMVEFGSRADDHKERFANEQRLLDIETLTPECGFDCDNCNLTLEHPRCLVNKNR